MGKNVAALYVGNKIVTGLNHGDAFSKLNDEEKDSCQLQSGFLDPNTNRFFTEECHFYIKQVYLVRHAQAEGQCYPSPLTQDGYKQAVACAKFLSQQNLEGFKFFSSPYCRCVQTSEMIAEYLGLDFEIFDPIRKQGEDESSEDFITRVNVALDTISEKSVLISHTDFILHFINESIGPQFLSQFENGVKNCSVTMIDARRLVCLG